MSWSAPNTPWNPAGIGIPDINSGQCTPEQWALMQQQNWHQWTQWQQQYSQWQNQYGDKYAQQMQVVHNIGGIPPPPPSGSAPPPLPDKPPPPPPHENNQPLFNNNKDKPTPALNPPQQRNNSNFNMNSGTGNNQWTYSSDKQQQPAVNSEDLKKLIEEERLFDIQFQKWEKEIDKWRQENVNHPDKQAYKDYEAKFEACRKQLLERRQQMKLKRANLLNTSDNSAGNNSISPPPTKNSNQNNYSQNPQLPNSQNNSYERQYEQTQTSNKRNNKNVEPQDRYESYNQNVREINTYSSHRNDTSQSKESDKSTFMPSTSSSSKGIPGLDLVPDSQTIKKQEVIDLSGDQPDIHLGKGPDYSTISMGINNILGDEKIMNILSMVRSLKPGQTTETETGNPNPNTFINDNPQFPNHNQGNTNQKFSQPQQYDERKNSMLNNRQGQFSQQHQEFQPSNEGGNYHRQNIQQDHYFDQNNQYGGSNSEGSGGSRGPGGPGGPRGPGGMQQGGPGMRQGGPVMHQGGPGMRPSGPGMHQNRPGLRSSGPGVRPSGFGMQQGERGMRQGGPGMRPNGPGMQQGGPGMRPSGPGMQQSGPNMQHGGPNIQHGGANMQHGDRNTQHDGPNMQHGDRNMQLGPNMHHGGPNIQHGGANMQQGGPNMQHGGPNMPHGGPIMQHGSSNIQHRFQNMEQDVTKMQQSGPNTQQPPPLMANRIPMPMNLNNAQARPPLQDVSSQQNADFYGGHERPMPVPQQPKPKWVEDPLFTPSIVVEYEHKPLRLKARDFIEPVHTFDYNHKSKDDEFKKKNFEYEADDLFTRKPRKSERDYAEDRYRDLGNRDLYQRDYHRRGTRDDFRDMPRDIREIRGEARDLRDTRELKDIRDARGESRDTREPRDFRDIREPREMNESKPFREMDNRIRDDNMNPRDRPRDDYERRRDDRYDDRRRDDRDRHGNRRVINDDHRDRDRDFSRKDGRREDSREYRRDDSKVRSTSRDKDSRKRGLSRESEVSTSSKKSKDAPQNKPIVMIDDILEPPGRAMRPEKIVIILRGLPGSGKSYLAKLIRDREAEHGGTARIMSIDDYFMQEGEIEETDPTTGKIIKKPSLKYEYDAASEESYINSLKRAFKRTLADGYFSFLIFDAVNCSLRSYADIWNYSRQSGFQVYICTMEQDVHSCFKRNIHNRTLEDIEVLASRFFATPAHHIQLDATTLLQNAAITDVQMEDVSDEVVMDDVQEPEVESVFTSKWEKMDDAAKLARLDGTSKPLRPSQLSMEEYLQLDEWTPNVAKPGKKTVRWADIEERRQQEKMRAIGFVVGQTDWNRMTDPTMGSSALTQTKYIERNKRN